MFFAKAVEALAATGSTLALRLTIWYAAIFAVSSFVAFALAYTLVASFVAQRTDDELREDIRDFALILQQQGLEGVQREIMLDTQGKEAEKVYFRIWASDGRLLGATDLAEWPELDRAAPAPLAAIAEGTAPRLGAFARASEGDQVRTAIGRIGPTCCSKPGCRSRPTRPFSTRCCAASCSRWPAC